MRIRSIVLAVAILTLVSVAATPASAEVTVYNASLSGDQEVPSRSTYARGHATVVQSWDGESLDYWVGVGAIDNVVAAHIHLGGPGVNGPVVAFLYGPAAPSGVVNGVLASGTITAGDLTGPLAGQPLSALIAEIEAGNAYVNVHTTDFPGGEIRGQLY